MQNLKKNVMSQNERHIIMTFPGINHVAVSWAELYKTAPVLNLGSREANTK